MTIRMEELAEEDALFDEYYEWKIIRDKTGWQQGCGNSRRITATYSSIISQLSHLSLILVVVACQERALPIDPKNLFSNRE